MRVIAKQIGLDFNEMVHNSNSIFKAFYECEGFTKTDDKYSVSSLLKIGFLLCEHYSEDTQLADLWLLINPKLEDSVGRDTIIQFIKDLIFVAVNLIERYIKHIGNTSLLEVGVSTQVKDPNSKEAKEHFILRNRSLKLLEHMRNKT